MMFSGQEVAFGAGIGLGREIDGGWNSRPAGGVCQKVGSFWGIRRTDSNGLPGVDSPLSKGKAFEQDLLLLLLGL